MAGAPRGERDRAGAPAFIASYQELLATVRDIVLPDPDKRSA